MVYFLSLKEPVNPKQIYKIYDLTLKYPMNALIDRNTNIMLVAVNGKIPKELYKIGRVVFKADIDGYWTIDHILGVHTSEPLNKDPLVLQMSIQKYRFIGFIEGIRGAFIGIEDNIDIVKDITNTLIGDFLQAASNT